MQCADQELHFELAESLINPAFIHRSSTYSKWLRSIILLQNKPQGALEMARIENGSDATVLCTSEWFGVKQL